MSMFDNNKSTTVCGNCGGGDRWVLHHIRHRGIFLRLCTTCVLRLHPQSFCPTCFTVYSNHPSSTRNAYVTCTNCYSFSHSSCVYPTRLSPYICPMCCATSKNAPIFVLKNVTDLISKGSRRGAHDIGVVIDLNAARKLVAAATISSLSMRKAEMAAKFEAERRAKEATEATKRAKNAVHHMAAIVSNDEKMKKNEGSRIDEIPMVQFGGNVGGVMERRERYNHDGAGNGGGGSLEGNRVSDNLKRLKRSSSVVSGRNVTRVESRENEVLGGIRDNCSNDRVENGRGTDSLERNQVSDNLEISERGSNGVSVRDVTVVELRENAILRGIKDNYSHDRVDNGGGGSFERNRVSSNFKSLERSSNGVSVRDVRGVELRENEILGGIRNNYTSDRVENGGNDLSERTLISGAFERLEKNSNRVLVRDVTGFELRKNGGLGGIRDSYSHDRVENGGGGSLEKNRVSDNFERLERSSNGVLVRNVTGVELRKNGALGGTRDSYSHDRVESEENNLLERNLVSGTLERLGRSSNRMLVRDVTGVELRKNGILGGISDTYSYDRVENRGGGLLKRNRVSSSLERLKRNSNGMLVENITEIKLRKNGILEGIKSYNDVVMRPSSNNDISVDVYDKMVMSSSSHIDFWNSNDKLKRKSNQVLVREMNGGELRKNTILNEIEPYSSVINLL